MRRILILICACVVAAAASGTASAEKPIRFPAENQSSTIPAGLDCTFAINADVLEDKQAVQIFPEDPETGDVVALITGRLVYRLTNLENERSIVFKASCPTRVTIHADGSQTTEFFGPALIGLHPGDDPEGPQFLYVKGYTRWLVIDDGTFDGKVILEELRGEVEDVCAALSDEVG